LNEIDINAPLKHLFETQLVDKNLLNVEVTSTHSLSILFGNSVHLYNKIIKYSKDSKNIKENLIKISSKINEADSKQLNHLNKNNHDVLNEIQMNENNLVNSKATIEVKDNEFRNILMSTEIPNTDEVNKVSTNKITLVNVIRNSLINNDIKNFEWALSQKDSDVIENTVTKMDAELIQKFIPKFIELFQSNVFFKKNLLPWLDLLFKHHFFLILSLPKNTLESLKNLKFLMENRTKNLTRLIEVHSKLENLMNLIQIKNTSNVNKISNETMNYEPLLGYNESDSEEELNKKGKIYLLKNSISK
jgi:hypothetical protein